MRSGWCTQPLGSKEQHKGCKHVFSGSGSSSGKWICECTCHGTEEAAKPRDRAAVTKGK